MARFTVVVDVPAGPRRTWEVLTDWPAHGRWVPLTTVRVLTPGTAGVGQRFVGRTGLGPLGFDDPMEVVAWRPPDGGQPGSGHVVKHGRLVLGEAWFEVAALAAGTSRVTWTEDVEIVPVRLTRPFAPLVAFAGRVAFRAALRKMAAEAARA